MLELTTGDTAPTFTGTVNTNLTGASAEAHIKRPGGSVLTKTLTITDALTGAWTFDWDEGDLYMKGTYQLEVEVTFADTSVQTFARDSNGKQIAFAVREEYDPNDFLPTPQPDAYDRLDDVEDGLAAEIARATTAEGTKVNSATYTAGLATKMTLPASPTDGQLAAWNASTSLWVPVNPSGNGELAYAENVSGTAQVIALSTTGGGGNFTDVTGCQIVVPLSTRPVYLSAQWSSFMTTNPTNAAATVYLRVVEVSNGVDTPISWDAPENVMNAGQFAYVSPNLSPRRLGTTARTRTFKLQAGNYQAAITIDNSARFASFITAEAR